MFKVTAVVAVIGAGLFVGTALGTPARGVSAETARAPLGEVKFRSKFANDSKVQLQTKGDVEVIAQRIVAEPGATFGWHSHPGDNVNVVLRGAITLYHDEACAQGTAYGPGSAFTTHPGQVHLARNEGTEELVLYATYLAPGASPPLPARIDEASPGADCPH